MKLATLKDGTRDGTLIVVSRDLKHAIKADDIAPTLQAALDDWDYVSPQLTDRYDALNRAPGNRTFDFDPKQCASPLPRAYQWADASAYVSHVELLRKARGADMPKSLRSDPLMYQGGSDAFLGPCDDILLESEDWGIDLEGEIALITGDVPMGIPAKKAGEHIRLLLLANDVSLRNLVPAELAKGFGFFQSKPCSAFSPVAVTADELGPAWDGGKLNLPLVVQVNGELLGHPNAGVDMTFEFPRLIAHAAKTRPLAAGTIIGSGTVSNADRGAGSACIAEKRALEVIATGEPATPFLKFGDRVRIEMFDAAGKSIFGAIEQQVARYAPPR
ncbi:MAG: fumarylacetoacetate hydrolase family protein [Betaproteobacteria bacterium]|nr:fumarylacetoacetate hydrolase family protein [Betaproteobacteria bacterium]